MNARNVSRSLRRFFLVGAFLCLLVLLLNGLFLFNPVAWFLLGVATTLLIGREVRHAHK